MTSVTPLFRGAHSPLAQAAVKVSPALRLFAVSIWIAGKPQTINVLAFTSCDAIAKAIDIFFDGDEPMPVDGLRIEATSMLPRAA